MIKRMLFYCQYMQKSDLLQNNIWLTIVIVEEEAMGNYDTYNVANRYRMKNDAIKDIISRINEYRVNPMYGLAIHLRYPYKEILDVSKEASRVDRVLEYFIHRSKPHNDTPARIFFTEPNAVKGYHMHVILEELPTKTLKYYNDKLILSCSISGSPNSMRSEDGVLNMLGTHLKKHVSNMYKSGIGFNYKPIYGIEGMVEYLNKSFFDPRVSGADHIDFLNGSIFKPQWINNRTTKIKREEQHE